MEQKDAKGENGGETAEVTANTEGIEGFLVSLFTPGIHPLALTFMNLAFGALFLIIFLMFLFGLWNIHLVVFTLLSIGLFISTQWVLMEMGSAANTNRKDANESAAPNNHNIDTETEKKSKKE